MRGQLGLERTPEEYIANMVQVFSECKRVLRDDGTLWLNCGDSYNGSTPNRDKRYSPGGISGLKPKDMIGIPWMLAFALRADGWYLRSDIIWSKPNPMPESVTDRPTKAHEYVFLLSKSAQYYYDADAVREEGAEPRIMGKMVERGSKSERGNAWHYADGSTGFGTTGTRNRRTVWEIATQPTKEAHFATYPEKLVEPCILAGTSARGCCPKCGAGWERVVEKSIVSVSGSKRYNGNGDRNDSESGRTDRETTTTGWQPTCTCDAGDPVPCTVFDPFSGSGTTGRVALRLGRRYVGLELSWEYITEITPKRMTVQMGMGL